MHITIAPRGILQVDDARITYKNFRGEGTKYNREGDRNFALIIPDQEQANELIESGWNVRIKPPRIDGDDPFMYLPVKVKFNERGPACYLVSGCNMNRLDEDSIGCLDDVDILSIDLDIRPYDWGPIGPEQKYGRTAYLQSIKVTQRITDRFAREFEHRHDITDEDASF